ncbi:hypothetical protein [Umezawaea sp. Da 62-37]|uniref:hypothetical protein n=1 Tax=Umezawaea sp. Da 62-37 TaxID=3075927 RepID=UPI0028F71945|nr:hypothetical protein [Umezawaea sp. Da 62-37]WNV89799.1 hypothetical protein RM788_16310 [Umezawaea sp. Da 62-37]
MTHPGDGQGGWGGQQGGWAQPSYPQTGGFPQQQQQQSQYGGLGVYSGGPPPERPNRGPWLVVGVIVAVLLLVGGGLTVFLLNRDSGGEAGPTTSSAPVTTSSEAPTESSAPPATTCEPHAANWTCVPVKSVGFGYDVPESWKPSSPTGVGIVEGLPDVKLIGLATYGDYKCGGKNYNRGNTGAALLPKGDAGATAKDIATKLSTQYYKSAPTSNAVVSDPKEVTVPNTTAKGVLVDSVITTSGNNCLATKGSIRILVLQSADNLHVFMANGDLEGGSADAPAAVAPADLQAMVDSVKPLS